MCDETTFDRFRNETALTRRDLGAISLGVGVALLTPRAAHALDVAAADVDVRTPDGVADCHDAALA